MISSVDYAPAELAAQVPLSVTLVRPLPSSVPNRVGALLGVFDRPVQWTNENGKAVEVTHAVLWARAKGSAIGAGARNLAVGIAYVVDQSLLEDETLDLAKTYYVAVGMASDAGR
jgi:hypothetical protein